MYVCMYVHHTLIIVWAMKDCTYLLHAEVRILAKYVALPTKLMSLSTLA